MAPLRAVLLLFCFVLKSWAQQGLVEFNQSAGAFFLADSSTAPVILVSNDEWIGVQRAAHDLALDVGRVTGLNGTVLTYPSSFNAQSSTPVVIVGTVGKSSLIRSLIQSGKLKVDSIQGEWESYLIQLVSNPLDGVSNAVVIAGADKRASIYGVYDISEQMGVSPWYWWADVPATPQQSIYVRNTTKTQPSPSVKYRGIFLNDEQPALTNWLNTHYTPGQYGPGFNRLFYSTVFELLLRLRANYMWPAQWGM